MGFARTCPLSPPPYQGDRGRDSWDSAPHWTDPMTTKPKPEPRLAVAGRCLGCGIRVIRGDDGTGAYVTTPLARLDAAAELTAHAHGRPTYVLEWVDRHGLLLTRRTPRDLKLNPAGRRTDRIHPAHRCATKDGNP